METNLAIGSDFIPDEAPIGSDFVPDSATPADQGGVTGWLHRTFGGARLATSDEYAKNIEPIPQPVLQHPFVQGAITGASGLVPRNLQQVGDFAASFVPPIQAIRAIRQGYDVATGTPIEQAIPESQTLKRVEDIRQQYGGDSPEYQRAAGEAAGQILPQMLMAAGIAKGLVPRNPAAADVVASEVRPPEAPVQAAPEPVAPEPVAPITQRFAPQAPETIAPETAQVQPQAPKFNISGDQIGVGDTVRYGTIGGTGEAKVLDVQPYESNVSYRTRHRVTVQNPDGSTAVLEPAEHYGISLSEQPPAEAPAAPEPAITERLDAEQKAFEDRIANFEKVTGEPAKYWEIPIIRDNPDASPSVIKEAVNNPFSNTRPDINLGDGRYRKDGIWYRDVGGPMGTIRINDPQTQANWNVEAATSPPEPVPAEPVPQGISAQVQPPAEVPVAHGEFAQEGYTAVTPDEPHVSAIANRLVEQRVSSGELGPIAPGQGYSTLELAARGQQMPPEEVNQHISDLVQGKGGDPVAQAAAVRAEEARLSQRSRQLSQAADADPTNPELRAAADEAFRFVTEFHNGPVAKIKTIFHATGESLQGELPMDLTTYNGQREAWLKATGEAPPARVEPMLRKSARDVSRSVTEEQGAMQRLGQEIEKATVRRKLPTADEVRANIRERMGLAPCKT